MRSFYLGVLVFGALTFYACQNTDVVTTRSTGVVPPLVFDSAPEVTERLRVVVDRPDRMFIEHPPAMVAGGDESFVYRDRLVIDLGGRLVTEVFSFHGIDTGDRVELDTNLALDGRVIFLRSDHGLSDFDAWVSKDVNVRGDLLTIAILCRVTGVNTNLNRLAARAHWGIWLLFSDDVPGLP